MIQINKNYVVEYDNNGIIHAVSQLPQEYDSSLNSPTLSDSVLQNAFNNSQLTQQPNIKINSEYVASFETVSPIDLETVKTTETNNFIDTLKKQAVENPYLAIGLALGLGYLIFKK